MLTEQGIAQRAGQPFYFPIANDDEEVKNLHSEGAVDSAIQAEVPLDLHASLPTYQEETGKGQPSQLMVATTRQSTAKGNGRVTPLDKGTDHGSVGWIEPFDEHVDQNGPCDVHANLPEAEQEVGWYTQEDNHQPRVDPWIEGIRTKRDLECEPLTITNQASETNHAFNQLDEALQFTRSTSATANPSAVT